jgi:hypothetical protein
MQEEKNWQGVNSCWIGNGALHADTYEALEEVKAFFYAHSVTDADCENILSLKKSYFQLRKNSAKKQKTMYDFFGLKKWFSGLIVSPYSSFVFSTPLKNDTSRFYCILHMCEDRTHSSAWDTVLGCILKGFSPSFNNTFIRLFFTIGNEYLLTWSRVRITAHVRNIR